MSTIADLQPTILERFTSEAFDLSFVSLLDAVGKVVQEITPRLSCQDYDRMGAASFYAVAQQLKAYPLAKPFETISLDNYTEWARLHAPAEVQTMLQTIKAQGWKHVAVNMIAGFYSAFGIADIAEFGMNVNTWQPNFNTLTAMDADPTLLERYLYIDFPGQIDSFLLLPQSQQLQILTNNAALQAVYHYTFVYPVLQQPFDAYNLGLISTMKSLMGQYN